MPLLFTISLNLHAQNWHSVISVHVSAPDDCRADAESYFRRELRSLGDISVDDGQPNYQLEVILEPNRLSGANRIIGYSASITVCSPLQADTLTFLSVTNPTAVATLTNYVSISTHRLVANSDLRKLCSAVVTDIDTTIFEPDRKMFTQMKALFRKPKSTSPAPPK